jgi:hypothetical protein
MFEKERPDDITSLYSSDAQTQLHPLQMQPYHASYQPQSTFVPHIISVRNGLLEIPFPLTLSASGHSKKPLQQNIEPKNLILDYNRTLSDGEIIIYLSKNGLRQDPEETKPLHRGVYATVSFVYSEYLSTHQKTQGINLNFQTPTKPSIPQDGSSINQTLDI